jgi:hypothetical protein
MRVPEYSSGESKDKNRGLIFSCAPDDDQAVEALKKLNVPYLVSLPLVFQTTEEWLESELGVHPVQVALQACFFFPHNLGFWSLWARRLSTPAVFRPKAG